MDCWGIKSLCPWLKMHGEPHKWHNALMWQQPVYILIFFFPSTLSYGTNIAQAFFSKTPGCSWFATHHALPSARNGFLFIGTEQIWTNVSGRECPREPPFSHSLAILSTFLSSCKRDNCSLIGWQEMKTVSTLSGIISFFFLQPAINSTKPICQNWQADAWSALSTS